MEALLARAEAMEPALRVWVTLDRDRALAEARTRERGVREIGAQTPVSLHGVPVGVKDIFFTRGMRTTACSPIYADFVPAHDSTAVERLESAGGVVMGKTVTTEWACMDPPPDPQPVERRAHAGRVEQRVCRRSRRPHLSGRARLADGGLGPEAGRLQRRRRTQAELR